MRNKVLGCLGIGVVVLLIISLMVNLGLLMSGFGGGGSVSKPRQQYQKFTEIEVDKAGGDKKVVQIDLEGVISSMGGGSPFGGGFVVEPEWVKRALKQAENDEKVVGVVLRVNSPGGEVTASDVIYEAVKRFRDEVGKPVVVFMDSVAASGGYYIACGASEVVATPTTITGSIGVIMQTPNAAGLMEKVGVGMNTFASGDFKDTGNYAREMRPEEAAYLQAHVDKTYDRFVGIVATERGIDEDSLRNDEIADGRIFSGEEAAEIGLVDQVGYLEDSYALVRELSGVDDADIVRYRQVTSLAGLLGLMAEAKGGAAGAGGKVEIDLSGGLIPQLRPGQVYLLPPAFVR